VSILLGLLASVLYGTQDFIGGLVSRRNHVLTVVLWGQLVGVPISVLGLPLLTDGPPTGPTLWLGGAAGVTGMFGAALLFRGLARGRMSVVAPVTALLAAAIPVVIGLVVGDRPSALAVVGLVVALAAIGLVSTSPEPGVVRERGRSIRERLVEAAVPEAVAAGTFFAGFFLLLDGVEDDAGLWPIFAARVAGLVVGAVLILSTRLTARPAAGTTFGVVGSGVLSNVSDYVFLLGTRVGLLPVVVVLTSLYPVTTVLLARTVLKERIGRMQFVGLALAAAGVVFLTAG
jgi:drug/metabolite transporter (DMT)-like permease